jgi:uncharacterized protein YcnI
MWSIEVIKQNNEQAYQDHKTTKGKERDKIRQCITQGIDEYFDSFLYPYEPHPFHLVEPIVKPIVKAMKRQGVL